jgi:uncharacterized protein YbjT (DUF2867 family)
MALHSVFVTGATGYLGRGLVPALVARGHSVRALARPGSEARVPPGAEVAPGDALDGASFAAAIAPADTLVHLVGTPHPNPRLAAEFERVDLGSIRAAAEVARAAGVRHLVYVSVAQPAPVMRAYVAARARGEAAVAESGVPATVLRPWYVLGPGHRWAYLLLPLYALAERLPGSRATARRLGLVRYPEMIAALVAAVESPPSAGVRIVEVPEIRRARRGVS